jgi:hypothetical protein
MTILDGTEKLRVPNSSEFRFEKVRLQFTERVSWFSDYLSNIESNSNFPEVNIDDKKVLLAYVGAHDYFDYDLSISIDDSTITFSKYQNTDRHLVTGSEGNYIDESHELYLSAAEILRVYQEEVSY